MYSQYDTYAEIVSLYRQSLTHGCEFIYQSFSRMLNIWLDLSERYHKANEKYKDAQRNTSKQRTSGASSMDAKKQQLENMRKCVIAMTTDMSELLSKLPAYYFLTAFPLIMSRLTHPDGQCFDVLQRMVVKCVCAYPNQALWQFTSMCEARVKNSEAASKLAVRANKVLGHADLRRLHPTVEKFKQIFKELSELCLASRPERVGPGTTTLPKLIGSGSNLLKANHYDEILIPAQKFMTIVLPRSGAPAGDDMHNPFPGATVTIAKIRDEAYVYSSMQKPVRIIMVGTDGHEYRMIFKAMDDLRIDSRAMEFNAVVNMYLKRDAEARNRSLTVRTYTVLPLYRTNGIIEFIPNLDTMRCICLKMRKYLALPSVSTKEMRSDAANLSMPERRHRFKRLCLAHKPVLHEWYAMEFPNPSSWYTARQSYVRTLAVMSVVGYMLGLGDRHNDNILLDRTSGDIVHVDFNALFNKGDTMPCPERVPFRLTHSMIKAMGPLGYEGGFRYACEIVDRIIRAHKDQLISVLNTFLYDPSDFLTEQSRSRKLTNGVVEMTAEKLRDVEARMNGVVRKLNGVSSMPLSVEGQISLLIEEATNEDNLCQMFYGWAAYM
jgi:serine/threonine-protein kinase ATR